MSPTNSSTTLLFDTDLAAGGGDNIIKIKITTTLPDPEPCLVHITCDFCLDTVCPDVEYNFTANMFDFQNLTKFGSKLEYACSNGKDFEVSGAIQETYEIECLWNGSWTQSTLLPNCVCKKALFPVCPTSID